jgi:hypothetical protein
LGVVDGTNTQSISLSFDLKTSPEQHIIVTSKMARKTKTAAALWDPGSMLSFNNPDTKTDTCIGFVPDTRCRCQRHINRKHFHRAQQILDKLAQEHPNEYSMRLELIQVAKKTLCCRHQKKGLWESS